MKITNFIMICQAFVDKAKEMKKMRIESFGNFREQLERFASFLELPETLSAYISGRILKFHPDRLAPFSDPLPVAH